MKWIFNICDSILQSIWSIVVQESVVRCSNCWRMWRFWMCFFIFHAIYKEVNVTQVGVIAVTGSTEFASKGANATLWFPGLTESCPSVVIAKFKISHLAVWGAAVLKQDLSFSLPQKTPLVGALVLTNSNTSTFVSQHNSLGYIICIFILIWWKLCIWTNGKWRMSQLVSSAECRG